MYFLIMFNPYNILLEFSIPKQQVYWVLRHKYKYTMTQQNFIMFITVLGRHVSILIESSSGPSNNTDPYLAMFKMRCVIPNAYILDITVYKMHVSLCYCTIRIAYFYNFNRYIQIPPLYVPVKVLEISYPDCTIIT